MHSYENRNDWTGAATFTVEDIMKLLSKNFCSWFWRDLILLPKRSWHTNNHWDHAKVEQYPKKCRRSFEDIYYLLFLVLMTLGQIRTHLRTKCSHVFERLLANVDELSLCFSTFTREPCFIRNSRCLGLFIFSDWKYSLKSIYWQYWAQQLLICE